MHAFSHKLNDLVLHFAALRFDPSFSWSCSRQVLHFQSPQKNNREGGTTFLDKFKTKFPNGEALSLPEHAADVMTQKRAYKLLARHLRSYLNLTL